MTFLRPKTIDQLKPYWDFLFEGLKEMSDPRRANIEIDQNELIRVCMGCLSEETSGRIIIVFGDDLKPIGYGIYFENTPWWESKRKGLIYTVYVKGNHPKVAKIMLSECLRTAKEDGIEVVETWARRFNEAAFRYYEARYGFKMNAYVFRKEVE